jgi:hypothetical protein
MMSVFLLFTFTVTVTVTSVFKDKKSEEVKKQYKSRFFILFLLDDGSGSWRPRNIPIRIHNTGRKHAFSVPPLQLVGAGGRFVSLL